jgi:hypothetical protein
MNFVLWILQPWRWATLAVSGGGGGDGGAGAAQEEERRKSELRRRIDLMYGIDTPSQPQTYHGPFADNPKIGGKFNEGYARQHAEEMARTSPEAEAARNSLEAEKTKLGDATRAYYADQLADAYEKGERKARFSLARRGVLGGSQQVDVMSELDRDRDMGATRVDDTVRRALAQLEASREQERLNAIQLVNSGAGESAVTAAHRGLQNAFANAESAQKVNLVEDLFSAGADAFTAQRIRDQEALQAARYRNQVGTFYNLGRTSSGRVTPSA